jgi:regulator of protease activity HflC (stomatin/prohibitin superfamily)
MKTAQIIGENGRKYIKTGIILAIILLALITILTSIRTIGTGQVGVVTLYGKVTGRELGEGMHLVWPWGINGVTVYDIKVQKETVRSSAASEDLQDVSSEIVLNYRLNRGSVSTIHQTIGRYYVDTIISPAINEVFKAASAKYTAAELITERNTLKAEAQETLAKRLESYGITVEQLSITNFSFSDSFAKAIEDKQVAQQNAERAKFNLDAAKTDAEAQKVQAETLTAQYLQKMAIEKWDGKLPTYMGGGAVFNLPLGQ